MPLDERFLAQPPHLTGLATDDAAKWLSRAKTASKAWREKLWPKYRQAKRRYHSEIGYSGANINLQKVKAQHNDINLLYKIVKDFLAATFYRNPDIDLTSRDESPEAVRRIENLEQKVNDDLRDREREVKGILRSQLVDETLAGISAAYVDYVYRDAADAPIPGMVDDLGHPLQSRRVIQNEVVLVKIRPENLIVPPWISLYDLPRAPYLGYVDIVPVESVKADPTLDPAITATLEGQFYRQLVDVNLRDLAMEETSADDVRHVKLYTLFIRPTDGTPLMRVVMAEDQGTRNQPLAYHVFDHGHGADDRGWPIHLLALNEPAEGMLPPSEAWVLEPLLQITDHLFEKLNRHLRKSATRTLVKEGTGGVEKAILDKWIRNTDLEVIGIKGVAPGIPLNSLVAQLSDQALSGDHEAMFGLVKQLIDHVSRQPSFAKATVQSTNKTATESAAIQAVDATQNGDYIDRLGDYLNGLFYDWAKLTQRSLMGTTTVSVTNAHTGQMETRPDLTREDLQGEFHVDIQVTSFLPPNKAQRRQQVKETLADLALLQPLLRDVGAKLNARKLVELYTQNVDLRNPQDIVLPIPTRTIDQQVTDLVFHGRPMTPDDLGGDLPTALQRLMVIFGDDVLMADYEATRPGVSGGDGDLANFARLLESFITGTAPTRPSSTAIPPMMGAPTDVQTDAARLGEVARGG